MLGYRILGQDEIIEEGDVVARPDDPSSINPLCQFYYNMRVSAIALLEGYNICRKDSWIKLDSMTIVCRGDVILYRDNYDPSKIKDTNEYNVYGFIANDFEGLLLRDLLLHLRKRGLYAKSAHRRSQTANPSPKKQRKTKVLPLP